MPEDPTTPPLADPRLVALSARVRGLRTCLDRCDDSVDLLDRELRVRFVPGPGDAPLSPDAVLSMLSMTGQALVSSWPTASEVQDVRWAANTTAELMLELLRVGAGRASVIAVEIADDIAQTAESFGEWQRLIASGEAWQCERCGDVENPEDAAKHAARCTR